ncbi:hypothetical protein HK097_005130 [Rhizophlyctis rosea]|uniref:F-box domain-containing protein n=1 Tax=Rhizophlyctis rosea TaxID=64517 RepID=A0AAD5WZP0_9FUNG|nr:hypothetical protein HK097_005130 [Rhizophlyctis rosea]
MSTIPRPSRIQSFPPELLLAIFLSGPINPPQFYGTLIFICRNFHQAVRLHTVGVFIKLRLTNQMGSQGLNSRPSEFWKGVDEMDVDGFWARSKCVMRACERWEERWTDRKRVSDTRVGLMGLEVNVYMDWNLKLLSS